MATTLDGTWLDEYERRYMARLCLGEPKAYLESMASIAVAFYQWFYLSDA